MVGAVFGSRTKKQVIKRKLGSFTHLFIFFFRGQARFSGGLFAGFLPHTLSEPLSRTLTPTGTTHSHTLALQTHTHLSPPRPSLSISFSICPSFSLFPNIALRFLLQVVFSSPFYFCLLTFLYLWFIFPIRRKKFFF